MGPALYAPTSLHVVHDLLLLLSRNRDATFIRFHERRHRC